MRYISTRGAAPSLDFESVTLAGLASDGGLYVPEALPTMDATAIAGLAGLSYVETAVRVCLPFLGGALTEAELRALLTDAYAGFHHAAITPLVQLDERHWLLELFHGPTLAFKDVALQVIGGLFERFLRGRGEHLTIIGATSGDTGSAAIHALAGREHLDVFMLHPAGRVSDVQRRQMTTVMAPNVYNIAVTGTFDDAQALVKAMFNDAGFAGRFRLSAVNSINWARLLFQIVYYFYAAVRLGAPGRAVAFAVPTGNFGDVFAGYLAARMGLPVERLIVATNVNDILARALNGGDYSVGTVEPTVTPSMDIQVSSNFERLLFDLYGRDGAALAAAMHSFEASGRLQLDDATRRTAAGLLSAVRIDADDMTLTMRWASESAGQCIDPHTAIGLAAARSYAGDAPVVTLATAHPAKFRDAVERATGVRPAMPARVAGLFDREERFDTLPAELEAVETYVARAGGGAVTRLSTLANGLRVVSRVMPHVETVAVALHVDAGARHEGSDVNGVAHLFEHMVFKGTANRTARVIAEVIEDVGGSLNAYTARDMTVFHARLLKDDLPLGVEVIADLVTHPLFDPAETEREKQVVLQELGEARDTPDDIVFDHLQEAAFPGQALGRSILGTDDSIASLGPDDLRDWIGRMYRAGSCVLVAAGAVEHEALVALAETWFGGLPAGDRPATIGASFGGGAQHDRRKFEQAHLTLGLSAPGHNGADHDAALLFANAAGGGASSRLFQELREERGLAYSVFASTTPYADTGLFSVYLATAKRDAAKALALTEKVLAATAAGLTQAELDRARAQVRAGLLMSLEAPGGWSEYLARSLLVHGRLVPPAEVIERLDRVAVEQVRSAGTAMLAGPRARADVGAPLLKAA